MLLAIYASAQQKKELLQKGLPFEWSEKIGLKNIYKLLNKLSTENKRYTIAEALKQSIK